MITGDHPITARAMARRLSIIDDASKAIITGRELEKGVEHIRYLS